MNPAYLTRYPQSRCGRLTPPVCTSTCLQEERNVCLAAATRADALLAKLGQHAMLTRGVD